MNCRTRKKVINSLVLYMGLLLQVLSGAAQSNGIMPDTLLANRYYDEGLEFRSKAEYDSALFYFRKAAPIYEGAEMWIDHINCLDMMADTYRRAGKFEDGLEVGNRALAMVEEKLGAGNLKEAEVLNTVGIIYDHKGDYEKALDFQQRAILIKEQQLGKGHPDLVDSYNNLGIVYYYMGNYDQALHFYNKVVDIQQKADTKNTIALASTYSNIGMIHTLNGDYTPALEYLEKSVGMKQENLGENHPDVASPYNNLGVVYYYIKDFDRALFYQRKVLTIKKAHFDENHPFMVVTYNNLGLIYGNIGKYDLALDYFKKSLSIQKAALGEKHSDIAITHRFIGEVYLNSEDYDKALHAYRQALSLRKRIFGKKHPELVESYNDVARIHLLQGNPEAALKSSQAALVANLIDFKETAVDSNPATYNCLNQNFLLTSLQLKAGAFTKISLMTNNTDGLKKSLAVFEHCDQLIDEINKNRLQYSDKIAFSSVSTQVYEKAVETCVALYQESGDKHFLQQAYYFSEKSKAGVLRQILSDNSARSFGLMPDSLLSLEKELKVARAYYQTKISNSRTANSDRDKARAWENKLFALNRTYDSLVQAFEKNYPQYHELKYRNDIIDINTIPNLLAEEENALIEYFLTDSMLFVFTITPDGYNVSAKSLLHNFDSLIIKLREGLAARSQEKGEHEYNIIDIANKLYDQLFSLVKPDLSAHTRRITIIPHGVLSFIPFELLLSEESGNKTTNYRNLPYLLKDYQISYSYSGTLWSKKYRPKQTWEHKFAGYAPNYQTQPPVVSEVLEANDNHRDKIPDLPFTSEEVRMAANFFSGSTYIGDIATESQFKKEGGKYQILHLAMHAVVDKENPLHSKLIFNHNGDSLEDGFLNAYELYNMELDAELAVLSACNTGYGKLAKGEGVMSLGRAFAYAGCPSIVMSLWPAQDQATANIMANFYKGLSAGYSKDKALQEAKLNYLENAEDLFAHPFYWAGFVVQGDPGPITARANISYWWVFIGLIMIFSMVGLWGFKRFTR